MDINDQCTIIEDMKYADSDVSNRWAIFKEEIHPSPLTTMTCHHYWDGSKPITLFRGINIHEKQL